MSKTNNDVWSDVNNPNNSASLDDWADCNNSNNSNYIGSDYYEHGEAGATGLYGIREPQITYYYEYTAEVEKNENGKWVATLSNGSDVIETYMEYESIDECIDSTEETYPGCDVHDHRLDFTIIIDDITESETITTPTNYDELWKETRDFLAEENLTKIELDIDTLGDMWESWKDENATEITNFCLATSQEKPEILEGYADEKTRGRIIFAALQKYTNGINLLLTLKLHGIEGPLSSYSEEFLEVAGTALGDLLRLQSLSKPKDIFTFDLNSPHELAKKQLMKSSSKNA